MRRSKGPYAVLEGPHLVSEALDAGLDLPTVLATREFLASGEGGQIARRLARGPGEVSQRVLDSVCDADSPRGIVAVAHLPRPSLSELIRPEAPGTWLFLDRVQDPGNVGAIARVAEALGGAGLLLSDGCADANHPRALRASAGSLLRLPLAQAVEPGQVDHWFESQARATWIGLEAHGTPTAPEEIRAPLPIILALGSEGRGISPATRARLDLTVTLPLTGRVESLNVAVAGALVLYAMSRGRGLSSLAAPG